MKPDVYLEEDHKWVFCVLKFRFCMLGQNMSIILWRQNLCSTSKYHSEFDIKEKMILKLLFLYQISNAKYVTDKRLAYQEIELTEEDLVWAEKNHNYGDNSGAFYSPRYIPETFFLLGDKHCRYGSDDCKRLIIVKDIADIAWCDWTRCKAQEDGHWEGGTMVAGPIIDGTPPETILIKPRSALLQWKDAVAGEVSVSVFVLDAEPGYQCVGDVAVKGDYSELPLEIMDRYRCVKNSVLHHIQLGRLVK